MKTILAVVSLVAGLGAQQPRSAAPPEHSNTPREQWQRVEDIFREMGVRSGSHVADIGAGSGFFTTRLAKAVGTDGRVYAVDVNPVSLRELKDVLGPNAVNVEVIRGDENDPHLPEGRLDAALVVNAYHEFAEHQAMLARIRAALKPGGRLVLVEPAPTRADRTTRAAQTKAHSIAMEFAETDLTDAGFEIVTREARFAVRPVHDQNAKNTSGASGEVEWLLAARPLAARGKTEDGRRKAESTSVLLPVFRLSSRLPSSVFRLSTKILP